MALCADRDFGFRLSLFLAHALIPRRGRRPLLAHEFAGFFAPLRPRVFALDFGCDLRALPHSTLPGVIPRRLVDSHFDLLCLSNVSGPSNVPPAWIIRTPSIIADQQATNLRSQCLRDYESDRATCVDFCIRRRLCACRIEL